MAALRLSKSQLGTLNACWNRVYRKIFRFSQWESITAVIDGLGHLNFVHIWYLAVLKLARSMLKLDNVIENKIVNLYCAGREWNAILKDVNVSVDTPLRVIRTIKNRFHEMAC